MVYGVCHRDIALEELEERMVELTHMCQALSQQNDELKAEHEGRTEGDRVSQDLHLAHTTFLMQQVAALTQVLDERELGILQRDGVIRSLQDTCSSLLDKQKGLEEQLANTATQLYVERRVHVGDQGDGGTSGAGRLVAASGAKRKCWWDAIKRWLGFLKFW
ncbi:hypothetical protein EON65_48995 [archaeon]|nr:MAG: hypothetical protein EON65_48995 [archaeon]